MVKAGEARGSHLPAGNCRKEEGDLANETKEEISEETKKEEMKYQYNLSKAKLMLLKGDD